MLRLIGLFRAHQNPLYRLGTTPDETFRRLGEAKPLPEPQPDENGQWVWPEFGFSGRQMALNLSPLRRNYRARRPVADDHVEVRIFDGFLALQLGLGGVRARVEIIRALADAALELSRTVGPPSELGDNFRSPDAAADAEARAGLLGLLPDEAGPARERVSRLWELTRWQPAADWPEWRGHIFWPAEGLLRKQWSGFGRVAVRHPGRPVFMYVDRTPREELLRMALDRRAGPGDGAARGIVVAIVTGPGASHLDALAAGSEVLLVRPAAPADRARR